MDAINMENTKEATQPNPKAAPKAATPVTPALHESSEHNVARPVKKDASVGQGQKSPAPLTEKSHQQSDTSGHSSLRQSEKTAQPADKPTHVSAIQPAASKTKTAQPDWMSEVRGHAEGMDKSVRSFVKKNPLAAVAVAVGLGFAGSLIAKKMGSAKKMAKELS